MSKNEAQNLADIENICRQYRIDKAPAELFKAFYRAIENAHTRSKRAGVRYPEVDILDIWSSVLDTDDPELLRDFAIAFEISTNPVYPMPDLSEVLGFLRRKKIPMGIISNAQFYTPLLFEWFFDANPIDLGFAPDLIFYSYAHGRAKPSTVLFEAATGALKRRSIPVQTALYVGNDMLNDMYPAHQFGFQTALFAGDQRSLRLRAAEARCRNLRPEAVITELIQLLDFFP